LIKRARVKVAAYQVMREIVHGVTQQRPRWKAQAWKACNNL
jgi:hypothetical protein